MASSTYIYEGQEWVLTGRSARKKGRHETSRDRIMVEIRPVTADPDEKTFNKWVKMDELYHVMAEDDE